MISEVANALVLTYFFTEYHILLHDYSRPVRSAAESSFAKNLIWLLTSSRRNPIVLAVVAFLNLIERYWGASSWFRMKLLVEELFHLPKILFAAILYILALYVDCHRYRQRRIGATSNTAATPTFLTPSATTLRQTTTFLRVVGMAFLHVAPVYPFLAVLISFGFLFVIRLFELFHWPLEILNWPIYYGTLYGPFSVIYLRVKRQYVHQGQALPSRSAGEEK